MDGLHRTYGIYQRSLLRDNYLSESMISLYFGRETIVLHSAPTLKLTNQF